MTKKSRSVLVIAAHPDDEILGVGGTILKHVAAGDRVSVVVWGDGETSRDSAGDADIQKRAQYARKVQSKLGLRSLFLEKLPDNQFDTVSFLSIVKRLEYYLSQVKPNTVYTHHKGDLNIDHQLIFQAVLTACRPQPGFFVKNILTFETVSATEWSATTFAPTLYNDVHEYMDAKIEALTTYDDEMRPFPHPRSYEGVRTLAAYRGMTVGYKAAEAFEVIRMLHD